MLRFLAMVWYLWELNAIIENRSWKLFRGSVIPWVNPSPSTQWPPWLLLLWRSFVWDCVWAYRHRAHPNIGRDCSHLHDYSCSHKQLGESSLWKTKVSRVPAFISAVPKSAGGTAQKAPLCGLTTAWPDINDIVVPRSRSYRIFFTQMSAEDLSQKAIEDFPNCFEGSIFSCLNKYS